MPTLTGLRHGDRISDVAAPGLTRSCLSIGDVPEPRPARLTSSMSGGKATCWAKGQVEAPKMADRS